MPANAHATLLGLPREVRDIILRELLSTERVAAKRPIAESFSSSQVCQAAEALAFEDDSTVNPTTLAQYADLEKVYHEEHTAYRLQTNVILVCKLLHFEGCDMLFAQNDWIALKFPADVLNRWPFTPETDIFAVVGILCQFWCVEAEEEWQSKSSFGAPLGSAIELASQDSDYSRLQHASIRPLITIEVQAGAFREKTRRTRYFPLQELQPFLRALSLACEYEHPLFKLYVYLDAKLQTHRYNNTLGYVRNIGRPLLGGSLAQLHLGEQAFDWLEWRPLLSFFSASSAKITSTELAYWQCDILDGALNENHRSMHDQFHTLCDVIGWASDARRYSEQPDSRFAGFSGTMCRLLTKAIYLLTSINTITATETLACSDEQDLASAFQKHQLLYASDLRGQLAYPLGVDGNLWDAWLHFRLAQMCTLPPFVESDDFRSLAFRHVCRGFMAQSGFGLDDATQVQAWAWPQLREWLAGTQLEWIRDEEFAFGSLAGDEQQAVLMSILGGWERRLGAFEEFEIEVWGDE